METKRQWQEWINIILGIWLFISPFYLGAAHGAEAWNAYIFGIIVVVLAAIALFKSQVWEEWIIMAIGIWIAFAPVALGYFHQHDAMLNSVNLGALIFFVALWAATMRTIKPWDGHLRHSQKG